MIFLCDYKNISFVYMKIGDNYVSEYSECLQ